MKINRSILIMACSMLFIALFMGCTSENQGTNTQQQTTKKQEKLAPPDHSPHLSAVVENQKDNKIYLVDDDQSDVATVQVELNVDESTQFLIREGENQYRQGKIEDLKNGTKVEVWYKNIVLDGQPLIANGEYVVYEKP